MVSFRYFRLREKPAKVEGSPAGRTSMVF